MKKDEIQINIDDETSIFDLLIIEYDGANQGLKKMISKYNAAVRVVEEEYEADQNIESHIQRIEPLATTLINCFSKCQEHDSTWYQDHKTQVCLVAYAMKKLNKKANLKNNNLDKLCFELKAEHKPKVETTEILDLEDQRREKLRNTDYVRYVTNELSDATYDNLKSAWETVRHPIQTCQNTFKGVKLIFWDVGPRKAFPAIATQVYKRPWYYGFSIAETYLANYILVKGFNYIDDKFKLIDKINTKLGIKEKLEQTNKALKEIANNNEMLTNLYLNTSERLQKINNAIKEVVDKLNDIQIKNKFSDWKFVQAYEKLKSVLSSKNQAASAESLNHQLELLRDLKQSLETDLSQIASINNVETTKLLITQMNEIKQQLKIAKTAIKSSMAAVTTINTASTTKNITEKVGMAFFHMSSSPLMNIKKATSFEKLIQGCWKLGEELSSQNKSSLETKSSLSA